MMIYWLFTRSQKKGQRCLYFKMTKIYFYIICMLAPVLLPLSDTNAGVTERNIFLTQMLSLAEKPRPYFLINMGENKIQLMAKGVVLREWTADRIRFTQGYLPLQTLMLEKKSVQLDQLRHAEPIEKSDAAANTNATSDIKTVNNAAADKTKDSKYVPPPALDIEDMPSDYQLFLNDGTSINVVTQAESSKSVMKRYLITPILTLLPSSKKDDSAKIEIFFKDKTTSQTLFWAFPERKKVGVEEKKEKEKEEREEKTECIILPPDYGDKKDFQF
jgi:hypothetical protein